MAKGSLISDSDDLSGEFSDEAGVGVSVMGLRTLVSDYGHAKFPRVVTLSELRDERMP